MDPSLNPAHASSLDWAVEGLLAELGEALRMLEAHAQSGGKQGSLDDCIGHLRKVAGIFTMTRMKVPQLLCEELQTAVNQYPQQTGQAAQDTLSLMAQAISELTRYLGNPGRTNPLVAQINNLRALGGQALFAESPAFGINLEPGIWAFRRGAGQPLDSEVIRKVRMRYQRTLLGLLRDGTTSEHLANLREVFRILYQLGETSYLSALGYAGLTLTERLQSDNLQLGVAVRSQLKRIDGVLRKLIVGTDYQDTGLLRNILYCVATGTDHGVLSTRLIEIFALEACTDGAAADDPGTGSTRSNLIAESRVALDRIKTSVNRCIEADWQWDLLGEVPSSLAMVEGALRLYPLVELARLADCAVRYVGDSLLEHRRQPSQSEIDLFAEVIVAIDYYLECLQQGATFDPECLVERALDNCARLGFPPRDVPEDAPGKLVGETGASPEEIAATVHSAPDPAAERTRRLMPLHSLMAKSLDRLIMAEQLVADWTAGELAPEDLDLLLDDLNRLRQTATRCKVDQIAQLCELLAKVQAGFSGEHELDEATSDWFGRAYALLLSMLDAVAAWQVVPRIEPGLRASRPAVPAESAETEQQAVPEPDGPGEGQAREPEPPIDIESGTAAEQDIDSILVEGDDGFEAELLDTFLEEADDLVREIGAGISNWRKDSAALSNADLIHRALHTLKGGARLSGLPQLGKLSHEFESFIIDQQVLHSADESFFARALDWLDRLNAQIEAVREARLTGSPVSEAAAVEEPRLAPVDEQPAPERTRSLSAEQLVPSDPGATPVKDETGAAAAGGDGPAADERAGDARRDQQDSIRLRADLVEDMVNLSREATVYRGRVEAQLTGMDGQLEELEVTIDRIQQLARRLDAETEAHIRFCSEQLAESGEDGAFDPLEMDRYSMLQQLSQQLIESASDLQDLRASLVAGNRDAGAILVQSARIQNELSGHLMRTRMIPFEQIVPRLERITRQISRELGKRAELRTQDISGEFDRTLLEQLVPPIEHILRNAIDHGIEDAAGRAAAGKRKTGRITLNLHRQGSHMVLVLEDDGAGIDYEAIRTRAVSEGLADTRSVTAMTEDQLTELLLTPGFSTAETLTQISGRGIGMDVVRSTIGNMGGNLKVSSVAGRGSRFELSLPFTTLVNRALMVHIGEDTYALPLAALEALVRLTKADLEGYYKNPGKKLSYGGDDYEFGYLGELLRIREKPPLEALVDSTVSLVLFHVREHRVALLIDEVIGSSEVVVKSLSWPFNSVPGLSGAAIMGDGSVVVTLDMPDLIDAHFSALRSGATGLTIEESGYAPLIMVVDDSVTVRKVTSRFLTRHGFSVETARDGAEALRLIHDLEPDLVLLDVEMPRMDGFELLGALRSTDQFRDLPVILITSRTGEKHRQRGLSLGASAYHGKPFREDQLLQEIQRVLARPEPDHE